MDMSTAINRSRQARWWGHMALINPETSTLIQRRHSYTGNLTSETSGDSRNAVLIMEMFWVCINDNELQKLPEQLQCRADATELGSLPV